MKTFIVKRAYESDIKVILSDAGLFRTKASENSADSFNVVFFDRPEQSGTLVIPGSNDDLPGVASVAGVTMVYLEGTKLEQKDYEYEVKQRDPEDIPEPREVWNQI